MSHAISSLEHDRILIYIMPRKKNTCDSANILEINGKVDRQKVLLLIFFLRRLYRTRI